MLGKNQSVKIYEAGVPIDQQPTHVSVFTRQELTDFMRDRKIVFSPKDIRKGAIQLSPHALQALNQSGLRSVLEPMHVMTREELQDYSSQRAISANVAPGSEEPEVLRQKIANGTEKSQPTNRPTAFRRFLERKRQEEVIDYSSRANPPDMGFDLLGTVFSDRVQETRQHTLTRATRQTLGRVTLACAALTLAGSAYAVNQLGESTLPRLYDAVSHTVEQFSPRTR